MPAHGIRFCNLGTRFVSSLVMWRRSSKSLIALALILFIPGGGLRAGSNPRQWLWWGILQTVPSPVLVDDRGPAGNGIVTSLRWQVVPVNVSWNANKFVSPVEGFFVNPIRRYGGSAELFFQPEWALTSFENSGLQRFSAGAGLRVVLPLIGDGEYLACSFGGKHMFRWNANNSSEGSNAVELGLYTFLGIVGLQTSFDTSNLSRYSIGLTLRYF